MKVTVFGATGRTGQPLVRKAIDAGHQVTAFARTPSKLKINDPDLDVLQGNVLEPMSVDKAIEGADAVISVLAPPNNEPDYVISRGTENILEAMRRHDVRRLIVSVGAGIRDPQDDPGFLDQIFGALVKLFSRHVYEDMHRVAERVRNSDRAWTIVRVPMLTDGPETDKLRVSYLGGDVGIRLSRGNLAAYLVEQLEDTSQIGRAPVISD
jgi:nucleoside-diphosphate-sugar epimerase